MTTIHVALRVVHITMGLVALGAGAASMIVTKGSRAHARAGTLFFGAMMVMATTGATLAAFISPNVGNVMGGLLASYLTLTAWATVHHAPRTTGRLDVFGALLGAATAAVGLGAATIALRAPTGTYFGYSYRLYLAFGGAALVGTLLDVRMMLRGGFAGAARTTRHLTRMCLALFMATSSFFLGQAKLFPPGVRASGVLKVPVLLVVGALLYHLVRIRLWPTFRRWRVARPAAGLR